MSVGHSSPGSGDPVRYVGSPEDVDWERSVQCTRELESGQSFRIDLVPETVWGPGRP